MTAEEKTDYQGQITDATTVDEVNAIVEAATAQNLANAKDWAEGEIGGLDNLDDADKQGFIDQLPGATTVAEVEQIVENAKLANENSETTPGEGTTPGDNETTPGEGTTPGDGETTPGEGATPGDGETTPGEGTTPGSGETTPGEGTTPGSGETTPGEGTTPGSGETTPGDGETTPGEGATPGDGETTPGEGTTPGDGETTPGEGTTPGDGETTPDEGTTPGSGETTPGEGTMPGSGETTPGEGTTPVTAESIPENGGSSQDNGTVPSTNGTESGYNGGNQGVVGQVTGQESSINGAGTPVNQALTVGDVPGTELVQLATPTDTTLQDAKNAANREIDDLKVLPDADKQGYKDRVNYATTVEEVQGILEDAQKQDKSALAANVLADKKKEAISKINKMKHLSNVQKQDYVDQIGDATTINDVEHILDQARKQNVEKKVDKAPTEASRFNIWPYIIALLIVSASLLAWANRNRNN